MENKIGKIIRYDQSTGNGSILLKDKTYLDFDVKQWQDFDILPEYGLEVKIDDGKIHPLKVNEQTVADNSKPNDKENLQAGIDLFIQQSIKYGWRLEFKNENGFSMINEKDYFSVSAFLIYAFLIGIVLYFIIGILGVLIAVVISFMFASSKERHTLTAKLDKETNKMMVLIDDEDMGYITKNGKLHSTKSKKSIIDDLKKLVVE